MLRTLACSTLVVLTAAASMSSAQALYTRGLLRLPLELGGGGQPARALGTVNSYMRALKRAGRRCEVSSYEYGGLIACQTENPDRPVLIDLAAQPSRHPDTILVSAVRPDGRNSADLPRAEIPGVLSALVRSGTAR